MPDTEARDPRLAWDGRGAFRVRVKRHRKDGVDEAEVRMPA
jgi:hypothetical protein